MKKNSLISINDLSIQDVEAILELAEEVKEFPDSHKESLSGKMFGLIFEKPSTRTWISFDAGIFSLGGSTIYLGPQDIKLGIREEVRDVARVLDRYLSGVVLRTFSHQTILEFEKYFKKPVINGLSDWEHPCQAFADFFTLYEKFPRKQNPRICFIGDGNNVLNSLMLLAAKLGGHLTYATPKKHEPNAKVVKEALAMAKKSKAVIQGFSCAEEAVREADVVYTDVWVSMGEENQSRQKKKAFEGMQVNRKLLSKAKKGALVMHCLPAHRGEEITNDVLESKQAIVFDQAENRMHVQKAILLYLTRESR